MPGSLLHCQNTENLWICLSHFTDTSFFIKTLNSQWFQTLYFHFKGNWNIQSVFLALFLKNIFPSTFHVACYTTYVALKCLHFQPACICPASWVLWITSVCVFCSFWFGTCLDSSATVWGHMLDRICSNVCPVNGNCVFHKWPWGRDTIKKCFTSPVTHGCSSSWHYIASPFLFLVLVKKPFYSFTFT